MNQKLEILLIELAKRMEDAQQEAKYARSSDQHAINQARAEELAWCYNEIIRLLPNSQEGGNQMSIIDD